MWQSLPLLLYTYLIGHLEANNNRDQCQTETVKPCESLILVFKNNIFDRWKFIDDYCGIVGKEYFYKNTIFRDHAKLL